MKKLAKMNGFNYRKISASQVKATKYESLRDAHNSHLAIRDVMKIIKSERNKKKNKNNQANKNSLLRQDKTFIIMHHYTMNRSLFERELSGTSATLINVIRDPVDYFQ